MNNASGLLTFLLASLAVIGLTFYASRLIGNWQVLQNRGRRLRVLEGVAIGRDRQLLLVQVGKEVLVLGSSGNGVNLVHRIEDAQAAADLLAQPEPEVGRTGVPASLEGAIRGHLDRMKTTMARSGGRSDA